MKKFSIIVFLVFIFAVRVFSMPQKGYSPFISYSPNENSPKVLTYALLDAYNIKAYFWSSGVFDQNMNLNNAAGLYWPHGSTNTACFTAGLSLACRINGQLAQSMVSYKGEFSPGCIVNGQAYTDADFKFYNVKAGDSINTNPDYANWYKMVPYGAPFKDINNNGIYDQGIDIPGVPNSSQTIFICLTDAFSASHNSGEGFGGGITSPLMMSEVHFTAFTYSNDNSADVQYLKWEVINKCQYAWNNTFFSIVCDPDVGYPSDDFIGCDTARDLGFAYNSTDNDQYYGAHPPAFGIALLRSAFNHQTGDTLGLTSFTFFTDNYNVPPPCESDPSGEPYSAYLNMTGVKKDSTPFLDPTITSGSRKTKFCYPGDPESNIGWTEAKGSVQNCNGDTSMTNVITTNPGGDRRFIMSTGSYGLTIQPNEKQIIYAAQMVKRGISYKNSVTVLKLYCDSIRNIYHNTIGIKKIESAMPEKFYLGQNYPNPFNPVTTITYDLPISTYVDIRLYDITGKEIQRLVNERQTAGTYKITFDASELPSGIYFYRMTTPTFTESKKMVLIK
jgi:hypothetical protein